MTALLPVLVALVMAGCSSTDETRALQTQSQATTPPAGIVLDSNLKSVTGTPAADEMKMLITLQSTVPYPVMVPTRLPSGMKLDTETIGSGKSAGDPVGYYSFRYIDPSSQTRTLTFNQTNVNSKSLAGYYVTGEKVDGVDYQVYWHRTRDYLLGNEAVPTTAIVKAEAYIVVWQGQYKDAAGQPHDLYYSMSTGSWTGWDWADIRKMLASIKPLPAVGS